MPDPKTATNKVVTPKGPSFEIYVERPKKDLLRVRISYYEGTTAKDWAGIPICVGTANYPCGNTVESAENPKLPMTFDIKNGWGTVEFDPVHYPKMANVGIILPSGKPLVKDIPPNPEAGTNAPPVATSGITSGEPTRLSVARHYLGGDQWELKGEVLSEGKPLDSTVQIYPGQGRIAVPAVKGAFIYDMPVSIDTTARAAVKRLAVNIPLPSMTPAPAPAPPVNAHPKSAFVQKWERINNHVFAAGTVLLIWLFLRAASDLLGGSWFAPIEYKRPVTSRHSYTQTQSNPRMKQYTGEENAGPANALTYRPEQAPVDFYYRPFVDDIAPMHVVGSLLLVAAVLCLGIGKISLKKVVACIVFLVLGVDQLFWTGPNASAGFFAELFNDLFVFLGHHDPRSWFRFWLFLAAFIAWPILAVLCFYDEVVKMAHHKYHHEHKPDSKDHEYAAEMILENGNYVVVNFIDNVRQGASAPSPVITHISNSQIWTRVLTVEFIAELFGKFAPIALHHAWEILKKELGLK